MTEITWTHSQTLQPVKSAQGQMYTLRQRGSPPWAAWDLASLERAPLTARDEGAAFSLRSEHAVLVSRG